MERGLEDFYKDGTVPYRKKVRRKLLYFTKAIQNSLLQVAHQAHHQVGSV